MATAVLCSFIFALAENKNAVPAVFKKIKTDARNLRFFDIICRHVRPL